MITHVSDNIKKYKVSIFGETYSIISDEPEEQVFAVAQQVDYCMKDICNRSSIQDAKKIAVLTALQFASKNIFSISKVDSYEKMAEKLIDVIDETLLEMSE